VSPVYEKLSQNTNLCLKVPHSKNFYGFCFQIYVMSTAWCGRMTQMQSSKAKLDLFKQRQEQKPRLSRISKTLIYGLNKTRQDYGKNLTRPNLETMELESWSEVRILPCTEGNLETKYCGEGDWWWGAVVKQRQMTWVNLMWRGKNLTRNKPKTWKEDMNKTQNMAWHVTSQVHPTSSAKPQALSPVCSHPTCLTDEANFVWKCSAVSCAEEHRAYIYHQPRGI